MAPSSLTTGMLTNLTNPLITPAQLSTSGSQLDGLPADLETSIRYAGCLLTQAAGILLRLPQDLIAQAIVILQRFWAGAEGGSMRVYGTADVSAACLYMMAKLSASSPLSPRIVINVYGFLLFSASPVFRQGEGIIEKNQNPESYFVSDGEYYSRRAVLLKTEAHVLRVLGFQTHVALPHSLAINYLQALDTFGNKASSAASAALAQRVFAHLNTALLSPQLPLLTHQPPALATAAIYLAARELGIRLPDEEWWTVFDTEREELGFLVVGMRSMGGFAEAERERWGKRSVPMSVEDVEDELATRRTLESGE
ncbi:MAG: hypothetical protein M1819_004528 [Sarea resinae]|nr:MAG: hypothetical protein M1819_004528 [Sarea resinae]